MTFQKSIVPSGLTKNNALYLNATISNTYMSDKTKHIFKTIGFWIVFAAVIILCTNIPSIYWRYSTGKAYGFQVLCQSENVDNPTSVKVADIFFGNNTPQLVSVSGNLVYDLDQEMFYLGDGILRLPLDLSGCQNLNNFKTNEPLVIVRGTPTVDKDKNPLIVVNGLHSDLPEWVQIIYSAGVLWSIVLSISIITGIGLALGWLLAKIGIGKGDKKILPEEKQNRHAGYLLLLGIIAPFCWLLNPYLGVFASLLPILLWTRDGLKSSKKKVAIVGAVLCGIGFVVMLIISVARFSFTKTNIINIYAGEIWSNYSGEITNTPSLSLNPYINNNQHFSIHPPANWIKDESGKDSVMVKFETPAQLDTAAGQPIYGKIGVMVFTLPKGTEVADFVASIKKSGTQQKNFRLISEGTHLLAGGRLASTYIEATSLVDGIISHNLMSVVTKDGNLFYVIAVQIPEKDWSTYETMARDSLRTFEIL